MAITRQQADKIEATLIGLGIEPDSFRDWLMRRIYSADETGRRITGYRRVRGSHGETFVVDPDGVDELPLSYEAPKQQLKAA